MVCNYVHYQRVIVWLRYAQIFERDCERYFPCVLSPNDVGDDEYVEQNQKYDVRYHVCYPIACVEWTLYACIVAMSIDQSEISANQCGMHTHTHHCRASHRVFYRQSIGHHIAH